VAVVIVWKESWWTGDAAVLQLQPTVTLSCPCAQAIW
jgi:hypothetical protein